MSTVEIEGRKIKNKCLEVRCTRGSGSADRVQSFPIGAGTAEMPHNAPPSAKVLGCRRIRAEFRWDFGRILKKKYEKGIPSKQRSSTMSFDSQRLQGVRSTAPVELSSLKIADARPSLCVLLIVRRCVYAGFSSVGMCTCAEYLHHAVHQLQTGMLLDGP